MATKERVGAEVFINLIKRLLRDIKGVIFLIVDGHPAHKAALVKKSVESVRDRVQLFLLPPHSPELNPAE